jgi:protocatechuate 3,4-dioxygenase beta subunit
MLMVGVVADGYAERSFLGGLQDPLPDGYVLKMPRGSRIGGVVQDPSGQPIAGANILIWFHSSRNPQRETPGFPGEVTFATTDRAGHWTFGSAPTNGDFGIAIDHPDFPKASFRNDGDAHILPDAATLKLDDLHNGKAVLVLKTGLTLRGVVSDQDGYNVAGAKVRSQEGREVLTAADGSFALPALTPGEIFVTIAADGLAPQRMAVQMASDTAPLAVQLKPGAILRVRIFDETGSPMPKATVDLDKWQGPNTLAWGGLTDADGRVVWNSAPPEPMTFSVMKDGYLTLRHIPLPADGKEHTLSMNPQPTVAGRVTDAETKQPIASFRAIPGKEPLAAVLGTNGQFKLAFSENRVDFTVRIEADGYEPATWDPTEENTNHVTHDFELRKTPPAEAIQGVVLLPDGSPLAGAQVALATKSGVIELGRAGFIDMDDSALTRTGADGRFSFASGVAARAVAAVHQEGFGSVLITGTNHLVSIQLQPWGRVEGVLRLATKSNAGQPILLAAPPGPGSEDTVKLSLNVYMTKTDEQGNFAFEQAPPGQYNLYMAILHEPYSHQTPVQIPPGATAVVQIGGTGAILAGRLVFSKPGQTIDWPKWLLMPILQTKLPEPPGISGQARNEWWTKYSESEEGRARIRAVRTYGLDVRADGAFTVEGVPPGDYNLRGTLIDAPVNLSRGEFGRTIGSFQQDVNVPQPGEGQSNGRIDLGSVTVQSEHP